MQLIIMSAVEPSYFIILFILFFLLLSPSELNRVTPLIFFQSFAIYLNPLSIPHITELIDTYPVRSMSVCLHLQVVLSECIEPCEQVLLRRILLLVLSDELYKCLLYFWVVIILLE